MNAEVEPHPFVRWLPTTTVPIARAATGLLVAIACPLCWLLIRAAQGVSPRTEIQNNHAVYLYMLLGVAVIVAAFGYALGTVEQKLRRANRKLAEIASVDALTGLANVRTFRERLPSLLSLARRTGMDLSVVMFDVDHFKALNDAYGHAVGDRVLRAVGETLATGRRREDLAARIGGEEFALVLPGVSHRGGVIAAERVLASVRAIRIAPRPALRVSISAGVTSLRKDDSPESLFARADAALYEAKRRGRDRVA